MPRPSPLSEPGLEGFEGLKDGWSWVVGAVREPPLRGPPLSFGHFPLDFVRIGRGKPCPMAAPITLTPGSGPGQALALSHRGRGDALPPVRPGHPPLTSLRSFAPPYALRRGRGWTFRPLKRPPARE